MGEVGVVGPFVTGVWTGVQPLLPWLIPLLAIVAVLRFPMLGRGPNSSKRDPWRGFKHGACDRILERASGRCEGSLLLAWGRCSSRAVEADHVFPHSKGGPTVISNGQALCMRCNRSKGNRDPQWWYVLGLEKRRRSYFPEGEDVRVLAVMSDFDVQARGREGRHRT
ncbi:HNH endonuclease [Demequina sp. NBRC 110054]|uniref:HNH endonuclease n=1 Tax=Demequina sp. NBRC 110054 TaxID=1570343 RepID=UPI00190EC519|nr:HNH endonuclease signature motif containing protein [Demequina sp. NBRC 110054]